MVAATTIAPPARRIAPITMMALYRTVSAATEDDEAQPQRQSNAHRISLLERLYRLRLVSAGILWRGG